MSLISSSSRESVPRQTTRELSRMKKRKKKNNNNNSWLFILSRLFRRALFFLSFFPSDVSTLAFLHFFNRNAKRVFVSLFPSIQECNPSNPPSSSRCALNSLSLLNSLLKLSFFTSFVENVLFCLSLPSSLSRFLLPLESRAP